MKYIIRLFERKNIFSTKIGFVRTLLALGAFLTLLTNDISELTNFELISQGDTFVQNIFLKDYSIFEVFGLYWGKLISILILVAVFVGYFPQLTCLLQAWVHISICNSFLIVEGGDQIASNLCLLLIPICLFDNRINHWDISKPNISEIRKSLNVFFNVYYFLIIIQVAVIYLHASVGKFYNEEWKDGTCIYYWFTNNVFGAPYWLQKIYNFVTLSSFVPIFTWSIVIFELCLFACIFTTNKLLRKTFLILGLLFHLGIVFTHGLVTFYFSMAGALILYLDDDNSIYKFFKKLKYKLYGIKIQGKTF